MNLANNPKLLTHLAQSAALGLLSKHTASRLEAMATQQPSVRAQLLFWQHQLDGLTELQGHVVPSANVWKRIELQISALPNNNHVANVSSQSTPLTRPSRWWQWAGFATVAASLTLSVALGVEMANRTNIFESKLALANQQAVQYVALLKDTQAKETLLITLDRATAQWRIKRLDNFKEADDRSLQLWALPEGGKPQSIGVLDPKDLVQLQRVMTQIQAIPALAVSLEPKGGVPEAGGPTGPVLFQGRLLETPV